MARQPRLLSGTGMYHVMFRGINRQEIFNHDADYKKLKEILLRVKKESSMQIYAYCMMPNHVHLFLREENPGDISTIMKKILSHYATWFNLKYERIGSLFASRYKSIPVEDDCYFLSLARYIHKNPIKACLVDDMQSYGYSSYADYTGNSNEFVDIEFLLDMLDECRETAIKNFITFHSAEDDEVYEIESSMQQKDMNLKRRIISVSGGMKPHEIKSLPKHKRNEMIIKIASEREFSARSLERLTGISRDTISSIVKISAKSDTSPNGARPQMEEK